MANTVSNVDKREEIGELSEIKFPRSLRTGASPQHLQLYLLGARSGRDRRGGRGISTRRRLW